TRSARAGLEFPVRRASRKLHAHVNRVGASAPVFLTAVLEYIVSELLELSGNAAKRNKRRRIVPRDISEAI
ncbi:histone-fold-containing protein, partial [Mycena pura]